MFSLTRRQLLCAFVATISVTIWTKKSDSITLVKATVPVSCSFQQMTNHSAYQHRLSSQCTWLTWQHCNKALQPSFSKHWGWRPFRPGYSSGNTTLQKGQTCEWEERKRRHNDNYVAVPEAWLHCGNPLLEVRIAHAFTADNPNTHDVFFPRP